MIITNYIQDIINTMVITTIKFIIGLMIMIYIMDTNIDSKTGKRFESIEKDVITLHELCNHNASKLE